MQSTNNDLKANLLDSTDLVFISDVAAELKGKFDTKFSSYKHHLSELHKVAPHQVISNFECTINNYFSKITN